MREDHTLSVYTTTGRFLHSHITFLVISSGGAPPPCAVLPTCAVCCNLDNMSLSDSGKFSGGGKFSGDDDN